MKQLLGGLFILFVTIMYSCNGGEETMATIPASNDDVMLVEHSVASYDAWRPIFDEHESARKEYSLTTLGVGRGIDDPNQLIAYFKMDDVAKAKEFLNVPGLDSVMQAAGVTSTPTVEYIHAVRNDTTDTDIKDRILIKHKVKDFDAWLKVYDNEGMKKRNSYGLVDRALARGIDDPNMVYIIFAVSDWDKANARFTSDELKNLKTEAGVEGETVVFTYKLQ